MILQRLQAPARAVIVAGAAACIAACSGASLTEQQLAAIRSTYDEILIEREPLCIEAGPFPYRSGSRGACDRCQDLEQAGLLTRQIVDDAGGGYVQYDLSSKGRPLYRRLPDEAYLDVIRARFARQGRTDHEPDTEALARPRLCFGTTRFHSVADALAPFAFSDASNLSVKLVAEAKDTSGLLFDPSLAPLRLTLPPKPGPGEPALYPPRVVTFAFYRDGVVELTDLRYGAWVDEP